MNRLLYLTLYALLALIAPVLCAGCQQAHSRRTDTSHARSCATHSGDCGSDAKRTPQPEKQAEEAPSVLTIATIAPDQVRTSETFALKFELHNPGRATLKGVEFHLNLPPGLLTTEGQSAVNLPLNTLSPGQAKLVKIDVRASQAGTYDLTATVTAEGDFAANAEKTTTIVSEK